MYRTTCVCRFNADLEDDDYVTNPMLWCDYCSGRFVICINCSTNDHTQLMRITQISTYAQYTNEDEDEEAEPDVWLPVNCINVEEHGIENLDTRHDGISIWLKCKCDSCKHEITMRYWGD